LATLRRLLSSDPFVGAIPRINHRKVKKIDERIGWSLNSDQS